MNGEGNCSDWVARESLAEVRPDEASWDDFPNLPPTFVSTFERKRVRLSPDVDLHVVTGGHGKPVLLIPGWPQTWYAWRLQMLPLVQAGFCVVAVDPRGIGHSSRPPTDVDGDGYDVGTVGGELVRVMQALGHPRFMMAGHDIGMWLAYAMAVDHAGLIERMAVVDAIIPGLAVSPPLLASRSSIGRMWHFAFNRAPAEIQDVLLGDGRGRRYIEWQFRTKAAHARALPDESIALYVDAYNREAEALHAGFAYYRAIDRNIAQNAVRRKTRLEIPILAVGGELSAGAAGARALDEVASNVVMRVIPQCGHYVPEEAPYALTSALIEFFKEDRIVQA